jgi:hypothetical protein
VRFGWAGALPLAAHLGGLLVTILGYALFLWAIASNAFFAEGVRIQSELGHTVVTGGPYSCVRHPGYAGAILSMLATPFLLGSLWALLPSLVAALLYVAHTWLEDKTLMEELPGYKAYAERAIDCCQVSGSCGTIGWKKQIYSEPSWPISFTFQVFSHLYPGSLDKFGWANGLDPFSC